MIKRLLIASAISLLALQPALAAKLQILEFKTNRVDASPMPPAVEQTPVDFTGGATSSAAFSAGTIYVKLRCDVQCSVKFGVPTQTATTNNMILNALTHYNFMVTPGHVVSVIASP